MCRAIGLIGLTGETVCVRRPCRVGKLRCITAATSITAGVWKMFPRYRHLLHLFSLVIGWLLLAILLEWFGFTGDRAFAPVAVAVGFCRFLAFGLRTRTECRFRGVAA